MTEDEYQRVLANRAQEKTRRETARVHANMKGGLFAPGGAKPLEERKTTDDGKSEHWHQARLISWARASASLQTDKLKALALRWLHSIPNGAWLGGSNPHALANKMRAEGMTAGIHDLRLDYVQCDEQVKEYVKCPGLIIEMKKVGNDLTDEQREYQEFMEAQGFESHLCFTWVQAARAIIAYMRLEKYDAVYGLWIITGRVLFSLWQGAAARPVAS